MCDCAKRAGAEDVSRPEIPAALTLDRARVLMPTADRAVMCWACTHARDADRRAGMIALVARVRRGSGRWCAGGDGAATPIVDRLARGDCPRARFAPVGRGTRWMGVAWIGVPMPLRWLARAAGRHKVEADAWYGCGCIESAKNLWDRMAGRTMDAEARAGGA